MGGAASTTTHTSTPDSTTDTSTSSSKAPTATRSSEDAALKSLRSQEGLFIGIDGKAYDLTAFAASHPGGEEILEEVAGTDASQAFEDTYHSQEARDMMAEYYVGELVDTVEGELCFEAPGAGQASTSTTASEEKGSAASSSSDPKARVLILYGSQTGTARAFAETVGKEISQRYADAKPDVVDMKSFDPEDLSSESIVIICLSTYTDGTPAENATFFCKWLEESVSDWRVHSSFLSKQRYAIFGCGNSLYGDNFNAAAKRLEKHLQKLSARALCARFDGDNSVERPSGSLELDFESFLQSLWPGLEKAIADPLYAPSHASEEAKVSAESAEEVKGSADQPAASSVSEPFAYEDLGDEDEEAAQQEASDDPPVDESLVDMEEIGAVMKKQKALAEEKEELREMVTPALRKNLTKQGYRILGSHSGVKLCRWTKGMLRGRGGCYKHTFYGISSYQCMEMTPSLACANKCVFCWRHHTNPVGREWRWQMDSPEFLIDKATKSHQSMIKQMKGVPGVLPERFEEAMTIRHCALSLVGEPIMYPEIGKFLQLLHARRISSFLVTNAQFPDAIRNIGKVTQLYVSVDAATRENMKAIDRPLFSDFWERFLDSLSALKEQHQRTVFRLTLVKAMNMDEIANYARLVARGQPSFIEIKGVTFCGSSKASNITMENIPFHVEVRKFGQQLCTYLADEYEIACEHVHSCCIVIARKEFKIDGKWHTWINYEKFHELLESGEEFSPLDYCAPTPSWAVFGAPEEGFDPQDTRFVKKRKDPSERAVKAREEAERRVDVAALPDSADARELYAAAKAEISAVSE